MGSKTVYSTLTSLQMEELREWVSEHPIAMRPVHLHNESGGVQKVMLPDFTDQVRKGCILLDTITPGWMDRVDTERLDLENTEMCVLGQTFEGNELGLPGYDFEVQTYLDEFSLAPSEYGFALTEEQLAYMSVVSDFSSETVPVLTSQAWERLTATWIGTIKERRIRAAAREEQHSTT